MDLKVGGSDIRLCYQNILYAEHFAHVIQVHTTAGKTLATRQPFKTFAEPLKDDSSLFRLRPRRGRQSGARGGF